MTTIKLKNGSGAPTAGDLVQGEPALDLTNKRLYTEDSGGTVIEVGTNPGTDVTFADNRKAIFGAGSDLQIYHDGLNSYIVDAGTGDLYFRSASNLYIGNAAGTQSYITAADGGAVDLRYNGNAKLATTSTGIDVTGTVTADGLTVDGGTSNQPALIKSTDATVKLGFQDDTTTNTYSVTVGAVGDEMILSSGSGGGEAVRIDSSGNVGISNSNPSGSLHIGSGSSSAAISGSANELILDNAGNAGLTIATGNTAVASIFFADSGSNASGYIQYTHSNDALAFATNNATERMRIDSSGNVGIGTSSPSVALEVNGTIKASGNGKLQIADDTEGSTFEFNVGGGGALEIYDGSTERMRIDSSGNLLVGKSSSSFTTAGVELAQGGTAGKVQIQRSSSPLALVNLTDDGNILNFYKGTSAVGSIGTDGTNMWLGDTNTGLRIRDAGDQIQPYNPDSNATRDAAIDLGGSSTRWKDLYLSGSAIADSGFQVGTTSIGNISNSANDVVIYSSAAGHNGLRFHANGILPTDNAGGIIDADADLGFSTYRFKDLYLSGGAYLGGTGSANHLDDYEEGTWTPTFNSASFTASGVTSVSGAYVKIGDFVQVSFSISFSGTSGNFAEGDAASIGGLPFNPVTFNGGGTANASQDYINNVRMTWQTLPASGSDDIFMIIHSGAGTVSRSSSITGVAMYSV